MSIEYTMYLAKNSEPKAPTEILRTTFRLPGGQDLTDDFSVRSWIADGPVTITAWKLARGTPGMAEDNGVDAKLGIRFQLFVDEIDAAKKVMIRDLCVLLAKMDGDAVFFDLGDQVIIRRKNGRLEVNEQADFWTPELRALAPSP